MSDFIVGNDVSEFQGSINWGTYKNNTNFVVAKLTEGNGYIDNWAGNNRQQARNAGLPLGFYHFARPDLGNAPEVEAEFFCGVLDGDPLREGEFLALDFEVSYGDPVGWSKKWLDAVSNHYDGIKPLVYLNQYLATNYDWTPVVDAGYGLWLASYNPDGQGNTGKWPFMAMQQTSSSQQVPGIVGNVDRDVFFGTTDQLRAYGFKNPKPPVSTPAPAPQPSPAPSPEPEPAPAPGPVVPPSTPPTSVPTPPPVVVVPVPQPNPKPPAPVKPVPNHKQQFAAFLKWLIGLFK